jgi:hypothetical protein
MARVLYKELFDEFLEGQIIAGGELQSVVAAVHAYSYFSGRDFAFLEWLRDHKFECCFCNRTFSPDINTTGEEDCVLCRKCSGIYG